MPEASANDPTAPISRGQRKVRQGVVVSNKMDKSIVVRVERRVKHRLYKKVMRRAKNYMAHDAENTCKVGDRVRIMECRPLSRSKRWRLLEVLVRAAE